MTLKDPFDDQVLYNRLMTCALAAAKHLPQHQDLQTDILAGRVLIGMKLEDGAVYVHVKTFDEQSICRVPLADLYGFSVSPN